MSRALRSPPARPPRDRLRDGVRSAGAAELDHYAQLMLNNNITFSLWKQAFTNGPVDLYTLYFADSTGLAVQLDGTFNNPLPFIPQWSDELCGDGRHCRVGTKGSDDTS